jgi:hypothetical protein
MGKARKTRGRRNYKKKYSRKNKRITIKGGGCGCGLITGGNINPASFDGNLPIRYYSGQNDYMKDPSDPNIGGQSARNMPDIKFVGGGKKTKKIKGGYDLLMGSNYTNNPLLSFGNYEGAVASVNTLAGAPATNPSIFDQPIIRGFSSYNPPLA